MLAIKSGWPLAQSLGLVSIPCRRAVKIPFVSPVLVARSAVLSADTQRLRAAALLRSLPLPPGFPRITLSRRGR